MSEEPSLSALDRLAASHSLGDLLEVLRAGFGGYELLSHHAQGEFHHDVVLRVKQARALPSEWLVVSTNSTSRLGPGGEFLPGGCRGAEPQASVKSNGGVKEVVSTRELADPIGLWRWRCPDNAEFDAPVPEVLAFARTHHHFDPCELLVTDARSELREEHRERQRGGGWKCRT